MIGKVIIAEFDHEQVADPAVADVTSGITKQGSWIILDHKCQAIGSTRSLFCDLQLEDCLKAVPYVYLCIIPCTAADAAPGRCQTQMVLNQNCTALQNEPGSRIKIVKNKVSGISGNAK